MHTSKVTTFLKMSDDLYSELDSWLLQTPENDINLKEKACVLFHSFRGFN